MKARYLIMRMEKTFLFLSKALMMLVLFAVFFGVFSFQIPQLLSLNRTAIVSYITFFVSVFAFIRIYGGFPIGQRHTEDIRNSAILGTLMGDLITFIIVYVMGISSSQFSAYTHSVPGPVRPVPFSEFIRHYFINQVIPGIGLFLVAIFIQILVIRCFSRIANTIYFKINPPKSTLIIYQKESDLTTMITKIKKYSHRWNIRQIVSYDDLKLRNFIRHNETIFLCDIPKDDRDRIITYCYKHNRDIYISPNVSDIILNSSIRFVVDDTTMFASTTRGMSFEQLVLKRIGDILFSVIFLILTSPFMIGSAIAIKCYDHGPVFYKQARLTKNGREFQVLKFRSMIVNAEKETGAMIAKENDDRITPVGKFLRRFRLDELPQLFNILFGDMSVVGPRPERMEIAEEYEKDLPEFRYRLKVKAGLTGLAQIMSKYNTTPKDKLTLDLQYIEQYSIWLDIKLILQTLIVFLKSDSTEGSHEVDENEITFLKHEIHSANQPPKSPKQ